MAVEQFLFDNFQNRISVNQSIKLLQTVPSGEFWYIKEVGWFLDGPVVERFGRKTFPGTLTAKLQIKQATGGGAVIFSFKIDAVNNREGGRAFRSTVIQPLSTITYVRITAPIGSGFLELKASFIRRKP